MPTRTARSQAIVRREATQSQVRAAVEMKLGVSVMQRYLVSSTVYCYSRAHSKSTCVQRHFSDIVTTTGYVIHSGILEQLC